MILLSRRCRSPKNPAVPSSLAEMMVRGTTRHGDASAPKNQHSEAYPDSSNETIGTDPDSNDRRKEVRPPGRIL